MVCLVLEEWNGYFFLLSLYRKGYQCIDIKLTDKIRQNFGLHSLTFLQSGDTSLTTDPSTEPSVDRSVLRVIRDVYGSLEKRN